MVRKIELNKGKIYIKDDIIGMYEKQITKFGTGAKIDAPKEYIGKKAYIFIKKN